MYLFYKPSDRISLPFLAQIGCLWGRAPSGGWRSAELTLDTSARSAVQLFQGRSVLGVVLFTWLNCGCDNF